MRRQWVKCWAVLAAALLGCGTTLVPEEDAEPYGSPEEAAQAARQLEEAPREWEPAWSVSPRLVEHGPRELKRVALTFDACSTRKVHEYDERIIHTLRELRAPATVFLGGAWAHEEAALVRELAADPLFELENHTYTHPHLPRVKDDARMLDELVRTQQVLRELTGRTPRYVRPPYGEYDARVVKLAAKAGLVTLQYDLASGDPDGGATKAKLVDWVLRKTRPGGIVVMHMNHKSFHTAEALPDIIRGLRARGFELVTVAQLLNEEEPRPVAASVLP